MTEEAFTVPAVINAGYALSTALPRVSPVCVLTSSEEYKRLLDSVASMPTVGMQRGVQQVQINTSLGGVPVYPVNRTTYEVLGERWRVVPVPVARGEDPVPQVHEAVQIARVLYPQLFSAGDVQVMTTPSLFPALRGLHGHIFERASYAAPFSPVSSQVQVAPPVDRYQVSVCVSAGLHVPWCLNYTAGRTLVEVLKDERQNELANILAMRRANRRWRTE